MLSQTLYWQYYSVYVALYDTLIAIGIINDHVIITIMNDDVIIEANVDPSGWRPVNWRRQHQVASTSAPLLQETATSSSLSFSAIVTGDGNFK